MGMITQSMAEAQEAMSKAMRGIPMALSAGGKQLYILIKDVSAELEEFIVTGRSDSGAFSVFSGEDMQAIARGWSRMGLTVAYHSQEMEYMRSVVTIIYPQVSSPATDMKVSLIPWFLLPDRPYPVFVYLFATWHYSVSIEKSMRLSAAATAEVFRIAKFDKSTVSRSLKCMGELFDAVQAGGSLAATAHGAPPAVDVIGRIPEILRSCPSIGELEEILGRGRVGTVPKNACGIGGAAHAGAACRTALGGIPIEYSNVIKGKKRTGRGRRDTRKRLGRPRKKRARAEVPKPDFVAPHQREQVRKAFISCCRGIVLDAATSYHTLLL